MSKQTINIGTSPNDGTGTPLRTSFDYCNLNFTELYTATGPSGNNIVVPGNATITGNLTVDTTTLFVNSSNDRVGIGTVTPLSNLHVGSGTGLNNLGVGLSRGATTNFFEAFDGTKTLLAGTDSGQAGVKVGSLTNHPLYLASNNTAQLEITHPGLFVFNDGAGGTRMTLNSTGLAIGDTAFSGTRLTLRESATNPNALAMTNRNATQTWRIGVDVSAVDDKILGFYDSTSTTFRMQLTDTGNLGIGVTPSAWATTYKALQVSSVAGLSCNSGSAEVLLSNNYFRAASQDQYITTNFATIYQQVSGSHRFYTAPSGTAGNAITFTQAMTLDASGNWIIGGTSQISSSRASITNAGGDQLAINATNTSTGQSAIKFCNAGTAQAFVWWDKSDSRFYVQNSSGGVYLASTATSWTSNSDERLKDIIEPISNAVSKVGSLRAIIGKYKNDETNTRRSFLIAQDVQAVLPEAVDASNPDKLGVAYTDVIPLLVAAIKELTARVQTLEAK